MKREVQRIHRCGGDGIPKEDFISNKQKSHHGTRADLCHGEHAPVVTAFRKRQPMPEGSPQPLDQMDQRDLAGIARATMSDYMMASVPRVRSRSGSVA